MRNIFIEALLRFQLCFRFPFRKILVVSVPLGCYVDTSDLFKNRYLLFGPASNLVSFPLFLVILPQHTPVDSQRFDGLRHRCALQKAFLPPDHTWCDFQPLRNLPRFCFGLTTANINFVIYPLLRERWDVLKAQLDYRDFVFTRF